MTPPTMARSTNIDTPSRHDDIAIASPTLEVRRPVRSRRIDRTEPIETLLPQLKGIQAIDASSEKAMVSTGCAAMILLPLAIGAGFLAWIVLFGPKAPSFNTLLRASGGALFAVLAVALLVQGTRVLLAGRWAIPDAIHAVLLPVVTGLRRHVPEGTPIRVDVDLSGVHGRGKKVHACSTSSSATATGSWGSRARASRPAGTATISSSFSPPPGDSGRVFQAGTEPPGQRYLRLCSRSGGAGFRSVGRGPHPHSPANATGVVR